jgi:hypothetical protein
MADDTSERDRSESVLADSTTSAGNESADGTAVEAAGELDTPADTPFDHPLFLPAILAGLCVWFGYDGFINQDPEMLEHLSFNRGGFALLSVATAWFGYKGWKELSERGAGPKDPQSRP